MPVYLVTGVGRGLGVSPCRKGPFTIAILTLPSQYALMKRLAESPENTVLGLARNKAAVEKRIESDGFNALILEADITNQPSLARAVEAAAQFLKGKGIDVVINNAGYVSESTALKSFEDLYV